MPTTLPGFLLASGLLMLLYSLLSVTVIIKGIEIEPSGKGVKIFVGILGVVFIVIAAGIYSSGGPPPMLNRSN